MSAGQSPGKRREMDVMKLMMSDWKVDLVNDNVSEFNVVFQGPPDSARSLRAPCEYTVPVRASCAGHCLEKGCLRSC